MNLNAYFVCALSAVLAAGCSSSEAEPYAPTATAASDAAISVEGPLADAGTLDARPVDSGGAADAASDADAVSPACNTVPFIGGVVEEVAEATTAPAAAGGTLLDGTYVLGSSTLYTGAGGTVGKTGQRDSRVVVVEGNEVQLVGEGGKRRASATVTINGTTMTSAQHCPESDQQVVTFTATATQLLIFIPMSAQADGGTSRTRVQTYDRQ